MELALVKSAVLTRWRSPCKQNRPEAASRRRLLRANAVRFPCGHEAVDGFGAVSDTDIKHRLAAIMAADVAGYSRLMRLTNAPP